MLAIAFFTFTAQNCSKRDPYVIPGTQGNPAKTGAPQGAINLSTIVGNQPQKSVIVYIGLTKDSCADAAAKYQVSDVNGFVSFTNLLINKDYHLRAVYTAGSVTYKAADTVVTSGTLAYPGLGTLTLQ